jgi:alpha-tubulin suppressor-like RCC1 family protein
LQQVVDVSIGEKDSAYVDKQGQVYTWNEQQPQLVEALLDVQAIKVCCGLDFAVGLGPDKEVTLNKWIDKPLSEYHESL